MPSGLSARISAAEVCAGTTVTRQPIAGELAQDVALDAVVDGDDVELRIARLRHSPRPSAQGVSCQVKRCGSSPSAEVHADQPGPGLALRA